MFSVKVSLFLMLGLYGCSQDIGVHYTKETNIIGDLGFESGYAHDQAVDILFLVDESGSMYDDQARLSSYMPDIYDTLIGPDFTDLKWRVGITATDSSAGIYASVDYDDESADIKLMTLTSFLEGHWEEAGLDAAVQSVAWDTSFHRKDADLLLVYISDEAEQSTVDQSTYEQVMSSVKDYPFMVTESSIVFTGNQLLYNDDCSMDSSINLGTGYINISETVIDLCETTSWESVLEVAKNHVPTLNEDWPLTQIPVYPYIDNIQVYLDEVETHDWIYIESSNMVQLTKTPEPDTYVSIVYLVEPS